MINQKMDQNYMQGTMQDFIAATAPRARVVLTLLSTLLGASAVAQGSSAPAAVAPSFEQIEARAPLAQRFPAGSIKSEQAAQQALQEAAQDRSAVQARYQIEQRSCYQKFLVNSCLEQAKQAMRSADKGIKQVEIEANTWRRQNQVDERDHALAEQHARDQEESARRLEQHKQQQAAAQRKSAEGQSKNAQVQQRIDQSLDPDARIRAHEAKLHQQQADEAAQAPQRAANAAQREQRIRDAEVHRQEVERKKAENERARAEKKQQQQQQPPQPPQQPAPPVAR